MWYLFITLSNLTKKYLYMQKYSSAHTYAWCFFILYLMVWGSCTTCRRKSLCTNKDQFVFGDLFRVQRQTYNYPFCDQDSTPITTLKKDLCKYWTISNHYFLRLILVLVILPSFITIQIKGVVVFVSSTDFVRRIKKGRKKSNNSYWMVKMITKIN